MLILTEAMLVQIMIKYSPFLFSREGLKLIHDYHAHCNTEPTEFREIDIEASFTEESVFDCIENNDIPVEGLTEADSECERMNIAESAISDFLGTKTDVMGFTSHHTVVYAKNY